MRKLAIAFLVFGAAMGLGVAFDDVPPEPEPKSKYAVLVAIGQYQDRRLPPLPFAHDDIELLASVLRSQGYETKVLSTLVPDHPLSFDYPSKKNIEFAFTTRGDDSLLIFVGHGIQLPGNADSCLCAADSDPKKPETCVSLSKLYRKTERSWDGAVCFFIDASRADARDIKGIAGDQAPIPRHGVSALYSCSAGERSHDSKALGRSYFCNAVIEGFKGHARAGQTDSITVESLFGYVSTRVMGDVANGLGRTVNQTPFKRIDAEDKKDYVLGKSLLPKFGSWRRPPLDPKEAKKAGGQHLASIGMPLVYIPAGRFIMGSSIDERGRNHDEMQHEVEITNGFFIGAHEVTVGQFEQFVEAEKYQTDAEKIDEGQGFVDGNRASNSGYSWKRTGMSLSKDHPVVNVSWNDAQVFCKWLSRKEKKTFRLPTEAEWEYACRAGTLSLFSSGDDDTALASIGNAMDETFIAAFPRTNNPQYAVKANDGNVFPSKVGSYPKNGFGLFDMSGNVFEWCSDWYGEGYYQLSRKADPTGPEQGWQRVARGGSWLSSAAKCRSASRSRGEPDTAVVTYGFRVVMEP